MLMPECPRPPFLVPHKRQTELDDSHLFQGFQNSFQDVEIRGTV